MDEARKTQWMASRRTLLILGGVGLAAVAALIWLIAVLDPMPPRRLTLACGPVGSSSESIGKRYKALLEKQGVRLHLLNTTGSVENLALLHKPGSGVDLGFVDGGVASEADDQGLDSLGTIGYEPLLVFSRHVGNDRQLPWLKGKRVAVGPEDSDSRTLVAALARRRALDAASFISLTLPPEAAADALLAGRVDAIILVSSWASPVVRKLTEAEGIQLADFARADAYVARMPTFSKRVLPEGAVDLERDRPSHPITLLATKASLVAREGLHPALKYLLLEAMSRVHSRSGIFQHAGEFPAPEEQDISLSKEAVHYYKSGKPFLQRYLPFWLAVLVEEGAIFLIPLVGLSYPLARALMALYGWGMQRKIFLIYGELHWLESQIDKLEGRPAPEALRARMKSLEERTQRVHVARKFIPLLYSLKENLAFVRGRIDEQGKA
jgi:TRAP-type uncharacterized transport system substrate-binding protein